MRHALPFVAMLVVGVAALVAAGDAAAHWLSYPYSLRSCPASYRDQSDPVTVLFVGEGWALRSLNHIEFHTGWDNESGPSQRFQSHGECGDMHGQRGSGGLFSSRWHVRVRRTAHADATYGTTSLATPHHEDFVWYCGHAVDKNGAEGSGFDQGRRRLARLMAESIFHDESGLRYWGNDRDFKQCDGDWAGSNGYVRYIAVPGFAHSLGR